MTSREPQRDFFENAHCALFHVDRAGTVVRANKRAVRLTGFAKRRLVGKDIRTLFHPSLWNQALSRLAKPDGNREPVHTRAKVWNSRGKPVEVELFARAAEPYEADSCVLMRMRDARVECLLREQLQRRAQRASVSQERDRKRTARFLHDTAIQDLLGTLFTIDATMTKSSTAEMRRGLEQARSQVAASIESLRRCMNNLRADALEEGDLSQALQGLLDSCRHAFDSVTYDVQGTPVKLAPSAESLIYRIVQEALRNTVRHSGAKHVGLHIAWNQDQLTVAVHDNGLGFTPPRDDIAAAAEGALGIQGLYEQAALLGGNLDISSREGSTTVKLEVPLVVMGAGCE